MPLFEYTARNSANGQIQKGQVDVKSKEEVSAYLRKNRMMLVSVREAPKKMSLGGSLGKARVKIRDIVIFTRQFATMINAGLPLVQSLTILADQTENKTLKEVTRAVVHDVESGNTLADAFSKHPMAFSSLYVNMVAAGEAGGILDTILIRLATFLEKSDALIRKVKGAMIYPAVIFSVAIIAIAVLLIFVIPTFQSMFASVNMELPLPTRVVIGMSNLLIGFWWAFIAAVAGIVLRHQEVLRHHQRSATHRRAAAPGAGPGRHPAEVGGVPLHPYAGHPDLVRCVDPRWPGDHRQDRGQHGDPRRGHGIAPVHRGW